MAKRNWCGRWNYFRAVVFLFCLRWTTKCDLEKFALCDIFFFSNFYFSQIMGYSCQKVKKKNWGSSNSFQSLSVWKPNFEKAVHIIQHGLQEFIAKNIDGESTEASDLSHIL